MAKRSAGIKALAVALSFLAINVTVPFSWTFAASPLGAIVTRGTVTVGSSVAPTGTTVFPGDRIVTSEPALINFSNGSRIEMTKAAATFSRQGNTLVVAANRGLLRFNFLKGEEVQINAGRYSFTSVGKDSAHVGELGLNRNGQVVLTAAEGVFTCLNTASGEVAEVLPNGSFVATELSGQGTVTKGGKTLTDSTKSYQTDELKGKCLVAGGEAYTITGNTATVITVKGSWKVNSGSYEYKITDCTKDALIAAGATAGAAAGAATAAAAAAAAGAAAGAAVGISTATTLAIVAGVAGAVGLGVGIQQATKSPSSR